MKHPAKLSNILVASEGFAAEKKVNTIHSLLYRSLYQSETELDNRDSTRRHHSSLILLLENMKDKAEV